MREVIGFSALLVGILFDLFGCIGLVRLPDVYNRLQAATKCVTLGSCMILFSVMVLLGGSAAAKAFLVIVFILVSSPTAAHVLSSASHKAGIKLCDKSVCDALEKKK